MVVLAGNRSYMVNKKTHQKTRIRYEDGQYVFYIWAPGKKKEVPDAERKVLKDNRYSILAADDDSDDDEDRYQGFRRRA